MGRKFDVLLFGYYGFGNLGDELLLESVVNLLSTNGIDKSKVAVLSSSPNQTEITFGLKSFNRQNILQIFKALINSKTLLLGGGGIFQDATSVHSCLYYWFVVRFAKLLRVKAWAIGQSVGPLKSKIGKFATRDAFSICFYRGVRDFNSFNILKNWDLEAEITSDYVVSLDISGTENTGNSLLVNVRGEHETLSDRVVATASRYAKENKLDIIAVGLSEEDIETINFYVEAKAFSPSAVVLIKSIEDFEELLHKAKYSLGMRFHFILLSCLAKLQVSAASYDPKVASLAKEWSIPEINEELLFSHRLNESFIGEQQELIRTQFKDALNMVLERQLKNEKGN